MYKIVGKRDFVKMYIYNCWETFIKSESSDVQCYTHVVALLMLWLKKL